MVGYTGTSVFKCKGRPKKRVSGSSENGLPPTCEEIMASMVLRGYTVEDMDRMTLGMCINAIKAADRAELRRAGKDVTDPEEQYQRLKKIVPIIEEKYRKGLITKQRYEDFMQPIWEYERG